jgi:hypothetical protein
VTQYVDISRISDEVLGHFDASMVRLTGLDPKLLWHLIRPVETLTCGCRHPKLCNSVGSFSRFIGEMAGCRQIGGIYRKLLFIAQLRDILRTTKAFGGQRSCGHILEQRLPRLRSPSSDRSSRAGHNRQARRQLLC